jgi:hypothetical protein
MNALRRHGLYFGFFLALAVSALLMCLGAWKDFGRALLQLPGNFRAFGPPWQYATRWIGPATATYTLMLAAGILLGFRGCRKEMR